MAYLVFNPVHLQINRPRDVLLRRDQGPVPDAQDRMEQEEARLQALQRHFATDQGNAKFVTKCSPKQTKTVVLNKSDGFGCATGASPQPRVQISVRKKLS